MITVLATPSSVDVRGNGTPERPLVLELCVDGTKVTDISIYLTPAQAERAIFLLGAMLQDKSVANAS